MTICKKIHRLKLFLIITIVGMIGGMGTGPAPIAAMTTRPSDAVPAHTAATPAQTETPPNIIVILVDTLRADHTTPYGYTRPTTPNLDAWIAQQGVRFADASSTIGWTYPSNAAMATGLRPSTLGVNWESTDLVRIPEETKTMAEYLKEEGYYTAGFVATILSNERGFAQGYDIYESGFSQGRWDNVPAEAVNDHAINWLDTWLPNNTEEKPLFLFLYYFDPHAWYEAPAPYDTLYDPTYTGTLTADVFKFGADVISGAIKPDERDVEHIIAMYDQGITYWDANLGEMMTYLQENQVLDNALVVVSSDHGEMFGEHDKWTHRLCLYEEVLRVPMLMRYTGVISPGTVITAPVQNMDLMPTILDWAGVAVPAGLDALSLRGMVEDGVVVPDRILFSEQNGITDPAHPAHWTTPRADLRAVRKGDWRLIHTGDDYAADELYQLLPTSIYEVDNLLATEPERTLELRQILAQSMGDTFTITGQVTDWYGAAFASVRLESDTPVSATTAEDGKYALSGLSPEPHVVTPTLARYAFAPVSRTVALPPDAIGQDFRILAAPVSTTVEPDAPTTFFYTDTRGLTTTLEFPVNSVSETTGLILRPLIPDNPAWMPFAGRAFELSAYQNDQEVDLTFNTGVTLTFEQIGAGSVAIFQQQEGDWRSVNQTCLSQTIVTLPAPPQSIRTKICEPGTYAIFYASKRLYLPLVLRYDHLRMRYQ